MNRQYVHATRHTLAGHYKPSSFHVVLTPTRVPNTYRTLCGRTLTGDVMDALPAARSCESCLRIVARQDDKLPEDDGSTAPVEMLP